jgi:hypothetical protein
MSSKSNNQSLKLRIDAALALENKVARVEALNQLLVIKQHRRHQEITKALQTLAHPSSVKYIHEVLSGGFAHLAYSCCDSDVIAKWFSHALFAIGTEEAIEMIKKFAESSDAGICAEMRYRLTKISADKGFESI